MVATERNTVRYATGNRDPRDPLHGTRYRAKIIGRTEAGEPIFKCVGEGGFARVYEAESRNLGTDAVVKILRHDHADDPTTVDRILAEAKNVAQLDHPHIVKVLDVGFTADKRAYIAMERLNGQTLHAVLEERLRLEPLEAVVCTRQILAAMGYAHQRGIIHRDLKPDNIFLHQPNDCSSELCVKVIDFGLAKLLPKAERKTKFRKLKHHTLEGLFVGTPRYAAPEQFTAQLAVDQRADLYSIALILYRAIVGADPFDLFPVDAMGDAKTQFSAQTMVGHLKGLADTNDEPDLKRLADELPKGLDSIIQKALQRHPSRRFQRAGELDDALASIESALLARRPFAAGQSCGPYTIVSLIARGHIGDVYLARDQELARPVAIKTLKPLHDVPDDQDAFLERLRQEAIVLASIEHPNLPTMYMAQRTQGRYWIATEFVTGTTLRERRKAGPLDQSDVLEYAIGIASGLGAAHARGMLHLDLKPSNVLITDQGRVVVIDLGMAQALRTADSTGVQGSPAYTAPELLRPHGHSEATPRSDIYSLGILLYELLFEHPYENVLDDTKDLVHHHVFVDPPPLVEQRSDLSHELCSVVARCLSKDPGDRYPRMADVLEALAPLVDGSTGAGRKARAEVRSLSRREARIDAPVWNGDVSGFRRVTLQLGTATSVGRCASLHPAAGAPATRIPAPSVLTRRADSITQTEQARTAPLRWQRSAALGTLAFAIAAVTAVGSSVAVRYVNTTLRSDSAAASVAPSVQRAALVATHAAKPDSAELPAKPSLAGAASQQSSQLPMPPPPPATRLSTTKTKPPSSAKPPRNSRSQGLRPPRTPRPDASARHEVWLPTASWIDAAPNQPASPPASKPVSPTVETPPISLRTMRRR